jgi:hypothetical protein
MAGPQVKLHRIPTGGAARLEMEAYLMPPSGITSMVVSRAVSGMTGISAWTQIYSGSPCPTYVDAGDGTPSPLDPNCNYLWQVTDSTGTTQVGPLAPVCQVITQPDYLTNLLIRLLQGGIDNLTFPPGFVPPGGGKPVQVTTEMPQQGWSAMPFIVVNLDLIQQTEVGIGEDSINVVPGSDWNLWSNAKRIWRVSVFSQDAQERDFYRDSILTIFRVLKATVFAHIGQDVSHSFQASSGTDAKEWEGHTPGFYYADIMLELDGVFDATVLTAYKTILAFDIEPTFDPYIKSFDIDPVIEPYDGTSEVP